MRLASRRRYLLCDGQWRLGGALGEILGAASVLMQVSFKIVLRTPARAMLALGYCLALAGLSAPAEVMAHGGGLAADGCHNDRQNGGRHCHRGPNANKPTRTPSGKIYYPNCTAARQAGATPIYRGQPGYGSHIDRDGDGKACE